MMIKWMYFLLKMMSYWKNIILFGIKSVLILKKEVDSKLVNNKKILNPEIKSYGDEATDFHDKDIPKMDSNHTRLAVINVDFALKKDENYYLKVFLKECKYIEKEKK